MIFGGGKKDKERNMRHHGLIPEYVVRYVIEQLEITIPGFTYMIERFTMMNYGKSFWNDVFPFDLIEAYKIIKEYFGLRNDMARTVMYEILRLMLNNLAMVYRLMDAIESNKVDEVISTIKRYYYRTEY